MEISNLFFYGIAGYLLLFIYDIAKNTKNRVIHNITSLGFLFTIIPYVVILIRYFTFSFTLKPILFSSLLILFSLLLLYSALIEIPLYYHKTVKETDLFERPMLYSHGTYSFSRHPGFIWYTVINILFIVYFTDRIIIYMMIVFTICNFLLILVEDFIIFPRTFIGYKEYKGKVPFLFPLRKITKHW